MKRIDEKKSLQTHFKVLLYSFGAIHRKTIETYSADLLIFLRKKGKKKCFCPERPGRSRRTHGHLMYLFTHCRPASTVLGTNSLDLVWGNFAALKPCSLLCFFFHILKSSKRSKFVITLCTRRALSFLPAALGRKIRHMEIRGKVRTATWRRWDQPNNMLLLPRLPSNNV